MMTTLKAWEQDSPLTLEDDSDLEKIGYWIFDFK